MNASINEMSETSIINKCPVCDVDLKWSNHNNKEHIMYCRLRAEKAAAESAGKLKKKKKMVPSINNAKLTSFFNTSN